MLSEVQNKTMDEQSENISTNKNNKSATSKCGLIAACAASCTILLLLLIVLFLHQTPSSNAYLDIGSYGSMDVSESSITMSMQVSDESTWHINKNDSNVEAVQDVDDGNGSQTIVFTPKNSDGDGSIVELAYYPDSDYASPETITRMIHMIVTTDNGEIASVDASTDDGKEFSWAK